MSEILSLLCVTEDDRRRIREFYGKTEEDIKTDLDIILEWLRKQPHLPKDHDPIRLENSLLRNKFRIEQTKLKQDKYYTYRGVYSDFFANLEPDSVAIKTTRGAVRWVPLPKLLPTGERLMMCNFSEHSAVAFNTRHFFAHLLMILDLQLTHDYAVADKYLIDCENLSVKLLMKLNPTQVTRGFFLSQQAFSGRISRIVAFNLPFAADILFGFFRRLLDAKLFGKITLLGDLESLHEVVPKSYLPVEYGGAQESFYTLNEKWGEELVRQKDFLVENAKRTSNENLRIGQPVRNELFGIDGTFKKINLD